MVLSCAGVRAASSAIFACCERLLAEVEAVIGFVVMVTRWLL